MLLGLHRHDDMRRLLQTARRQVGAGFVSRQYGQIYSTVLKLHQLRDIELIHQTATAISDNADTVNKTGIDRKHTQDLIQVLGDRFLKTDSSFRTREAVLAIQRTAFGLVDLPELNGEIGRAWIKSSSIARKAGYEQTAYTSALQAMERDTPFAFIQQAKLMREHDGAFKALSSLQNSVTPLVEKSLKRPDLNHYPYGRQLAKVRRTFGQLWPLRNRPLYSKLDGLAKRTALSSMRSLIGFFARSIWTPSEWDLPTSLICSLETPYYHLGHYYDTMTGQAGPEQA